MNPRPFFRCLAFTLASLLAVLSGAASAQGGGPLDGYWVGLDQGYKVRIETQGNSVIIRAESKGSEPASWTMRYVRTGSGRYRHNLPNGKVGTLEVLGSGEIRFTDPDGWSDDYSKKPDPKAAAADGDGRTVAAHANKAAPVPAPAGGAVPPVNVSAACAGEIQAIRDRNLEHYDIWLREYANYSTNRPDAATRSGLVQRGEINIQRATSMGTQTQSCPELSWTISDWRRKVSEWPRRLSQLQQSAARERDPITRASRHTSIAVDALYACAQSNVLAAMEAACNPGQVSGPMTQVAPSNAGGSSPPPPASRGRPQAPEPSPPPPVQERYGEVATSCLTLAEGKTGKAERYLRNTCGHSVRYARCFIKPTNRAMYGVNECSGAVLDFSGPWVLSAGGLQGYGAAESFGDLALFGCKEPAMPKRVTWDGSRLVGRCVIP